MLLCACAAGLACLPDSNHKGFENADFYGWTKEFGQPYSGQIVTSPVRCGGYAARFEIREGDQAGPIGGYRTEVHELLHYIAPVGSEQWYGFSTYIPPDWPDLDNRTVIAQWHATPDLLDGEVWRSPPLAIRTSGGQLTVTGRYSAEQTQTENDGVMLDLYTHPGTFEKGVWHDWVFHLKWQYDNQGFVEAWLDDTLVIDYQGPIGYNDHVGLWFKWGIYRDDHPVTQVIYHDEYRRGSNYDQADPSSCDPP
jgi:hypothetical protein